MTRLWNAVKNGSQLWRLEARIRRWAARQPRNPPVPARADAGVTWPVWLWWQAENKLPGVLAAERRFFHLAHQVRYPRAAWWTWRKWRARPAVGQRALVHGSEVHVVVGYGEGDPDRLIFEDGSSASWMNCCEHIGAETSD